MTAPELADYLNRLVPSYAAEHVTAGTWTPETAEARAWEQTRALLPDGVETEGHALWHIVGPDGTPPVGVLWATRRADAARDEVFVLDLEVFAEHRRRGYARGALRLLEAVARRDGATALGLHVFGRNVAALRLYRDLGFRETLVVFSTALPLAPALGAHAFPTVALEPLPQADVTAVRDGFARALVDGGDPGGLRGALDELEPASDAYAAQALRRLRVGTPSGTPRTVGTLWYALRRNQAMPTATVRWLRIEPGQRRRGYASAAVHAMAATAVAQGAVRLRAVARGDDAATRGLWRALGVPEADLLMERALVPG